MCPPYNFHLHNGKFKQLLKNGQIIYDLSDKSAIQNVSDTNSITDNAEDFNPDVKKHERVRGVEISIFLILVQ
ncbi:hypothetical protein IKJ53_05105 [bacterium]|nr:hypothetical protein [bacterium]